MPDDALETLLQQIRACRHCPLPHGPRPIVQAGRSARILIIGQAPGSLVHASGIPWDDASGNRLREWTGLDKSIFYDSAKVAQMPMGFCYPGKGASADLPPRPECAPFWHERLRALLPDIRLTLLVGHHAQKHYLLAKSKRSMTATVMDFRNTPESQFPLPHPSWRSTIWMRNNPWFESKVLPVLRERVLEALSV